MKNTNVDKIESLDRIAKVLGLLPPSSLIGKTLEEAFPELWEHRKLHLTNEWLEREKYRRTGRTTTLILQAIADMLDDVTIYPIFVSQFYSGAQYIGGQCREFCVKIDDALGTDLISRRILSTTVDNLDKYTRGISDINYKLYYDHTALGVD